MSSLLGKIWQGEEALKAFRKGDLLSNQNGPVIRLCFRHLVDTDQNDKSVHSRRDHDKKSVWFSWVDDQGKLHGFRKLNPIVRSSIDSTIVTSDDHIEHSYLGHAFIFVIRNADDDDDNEQEVEEWDTKTLDQTTVICGYRPHGLSADSEVHEKDHPCHVLEICEKESAPPAFLRLCQPAQRQNSSNDFPLMVHEAQLLEPLDTTSKEYLEASICRWPIRIEKDALETNQQFRDTFERDLAYALASLPRHAYRALKHSNTCIYINKAFFHGPKIRPSQAQGLCFHPSKDWLVEHGYHPDKAGCVELYDPCDYMGDCHLWGPGGVLIHELSHAYHSKCLPDGYDNAEIIECYEKAMEEGLYDVVGVHGPQGPTARAYASENHCEYFAELSTAFLGSRKKKEEYNKWYPYNRVQVKQHDPRAYNLLCRLWKVQP